MPEQVHLRDYVWMKHSVIDGPPEKVSTAGDEISRRMWRGWFQVDEPKSETKPFSPIVAAPKPNETQGE